jgi:hypothetical protein
MSLRPVREIIQTTPTMEGAGVKLQRAFGFGKTKDFDPFLLLDDFGTIIRRIIWLDSPGTRTAGSRRSLRACRFGGTWRQSRRQGQNDGRRRAVDDGGQRDLAPGDAQG